MDDLSALVVLWVVATGCPELQRLLETTMVILDEDRSATIARQSPSFERFVPEGNVS